MSLASTLRENPIFTGILLLAAAFIGFVVYWFIGTVVSAVFIYYAVRPVYTRLLKHTHYSSVTAVISVFSIVAPVLALVGYTILAAFRELQVYSAELTRIIKTQIGPDPRKLLTSADPTQLQDLVKAVMDYVGVAGNMVLHTIVVFTLVFYLLRDGEKIRRWAVTMFDTDAGVLDSYFTRVDEDLESIFFGNLLHALIIGLFAALIYNSLNLIAPPGLQIPAPTLAGLVTGVSSIIPVLGLKVVYTPLVAYLSAKSYYAGAGETWWFPAMMLVVCFIFIDGIPDIVIRGYVSGRTFHIVLMILSYVFGALLFGWYGLFLGPLITVLLYHFAQCIVPAYLANRYPDGEQSRLPVDRLN